ncbi:hypothetical protein BDV41DRAFT_146026 [Aspergillus transmontanensis]|uniref:Uncharacterized protein n=1 Tax=Aspergillus transmontanensis TaxID=1034304 RepID=A0A5N6VGD6_9EURO|nr:hypothetical protein BDV41DRAFT_146026 [Aspergillus transmontanensis]
MDSWNGAAMDEPRKISQGLVSDDPSILTLPRMHPAKEQKSPDQRNNSSTSLGNGCHCPRHWCYTVISLYGNRSCKRINLIGMWLPRGELWFSPGGLPLIWILPPTHMIDPVVPHRGNVSSPLSFCTDTLLRFPYIDALLSEDAVCFIPERYDTSKEESYSDWECCCLRRKNKCLTGSIGVTHPNPV